MLTTLWLFNSSHYWLQLFITWLLVQCSFDYTYSISPPNPLIFLAARSTVLSSWSCSSYSPSLVCWLSSTVTLMVRYILLSSSKFLLIEAVTSSKLIYVPPHWELSIDYHVTLRRSLNVLGKFIPTRSFPVCLAIHTEFVSEDNYLLRILRFV